MSKFTVTKNTETNLWEVLNEDKAVIDTFESRNKARSFVKELATKSVDELLVQALTEPEQPVAEQVANPEPIIQTIDYRPAFAAIVKKVRGLPKRKGSPKKADVMRDRMREAKINGESQEVVIKFGMETFGFSRGLSKAYVKGWWDRVEVDQVA